MESHPVGEKFECMVFIKRRQWEREIFGKYMRGLRKENRKLEGRTFFIFKWKIHTMCISRASWTSRNS